MAANPQITAVTGVPAKAELDTLIPLQVTLINAGDEGDVYLNCWCASEGLSPYYPDARGIRLNNWRPAGAGQLLVYAGSRGLVDEFDPTGYGLCGGCNPDQECWPAPTGKVSLRFETGYLTPDPAGGWDLLRTTDQKTLTIDMGGAGISWPMLAIIGGVAALGFVGYKLIKK